MSDLPLSSPPSESPSGVPDSTPTPGVQSTPSSQDAPTAPNLSTQHAVSDASGSLGAGTVGRPSSESSDILPPNGMSSRISLRIVSALSTGTGRNTRAREGGEGNTLATT
ncbi:hypothetical protein NMY22_g4932 [Coprinellus aureogranulatus]|nr:hypothetical protein NMY22_g4932 [Coprinellus aureogranulatus]